MAYFQPISGSVKKGQTAMICQLCEIEPKLKWKCLDCGLMMCQRCRDKVHPKFALAEDHTIIDIKDISKHQTDSEQKLDLTKLKCDVHNGKSCSLYCTSCQELVCQTCIAKTHNEHNFIEVNNEYHMKLENIRKIENEIKTTIQNLTKRKQQLKRIRLTDKSNYDKVKQEILDDEKDLVSEIKKHTNKLIEQLDQKYEALKKKTEDEESSLEAIESQTQKQSQQINRLLQPINAKNLFTNFDSVLQSVESYIPSAKTSFIGVPKYTRGERTKIPFILGKLEDVTLQYNTKLKVEKKFQTKLKLIHNIVSCPDGSLWISDNISRILQNVRPQRDNLHVISNIEINVCKAAFLSGDLLVSVAGSSNLKLVPTGSTEITDSVFTVSPLQPTAVHVTCYNKVIVGAAGGQPNFPATGPRRIIVMDQTGRHEKAFQYDKHKKPIFTYPYRITCERNGYIAVIDLVSNDRRGKVVVLNQEGEVRNIYTGHPEVNKENNPFKPTDITTTPANNFVVTDLPYYTLHVLNSKGEIITFYNNKEMGILLPYSLSFSTTGQFYIGFGTSKSSKENAKLFKIDNFPY